MPLLPLVPPGAGFSPYASPSAMSGYTALIDLRGLVDEGLLAATDLPPPLPQTTPVASAARFTRDERSPFAPYTLRRLVAHCRSGWAQRGRRGGPVVFPRRLMLPGDC